MARTRASDYDEKRTAILRRAAAIFAEKSVSGASMADLAREIGASKSLIYHYYESKDDLVFDIVHSHLMEIEEVFAEVDDPQLSAEEKIRLLVRLLLERYRDADNHHKVQLNGIGNLPEDKARQIQDVERRIVNNLSDLIVAFHPAVKNDKRLVKPVTMSLFGIINWVYMWFKEDGPMTREEYADLAVSIFLNGIRSIR